MLAGEKPKLRATPRSSDQRLYGLRGDKDARAHSWIEFVTSRADLFFRFRRKDFGGVLGNLLMVAWWVLDVSVFGHFYEGRKGAQQ